MLPTPSEVEVQDVPEGPKDTRYLTVLPCLCANLDGNAMTDTELAVQCEDNVTCTDLEYNPGATIVSPLILSISGVAGQIWALYYLYTTTRPQHSRTVFFVLLSTLIWTDLIGKIITTPPALVAYSHGKWVGGIPLCNFHGFSMMLISLVTHLLVSTMAVERFIGIRHGYFYNKNITTSRTKLLLLGIWLFSVLFCAMPLFGVGQYALQYPGSWCFVNIHVNESTPLHHRIYTNVFGCFTLISLLVMVVCNIVVITTLLCIRLCRHRCSGNQFCGPQRNSRQRELEMQMVIVLLVITIVFLGSWSPIDMRLFMNQIWPHKTQQDHFQDLVAVRLTSINQIIDPWAYIICRKIFTTRVWHWIRKPLLGRSWLLRRESSSLAQLGSRRKISRTLTPGEKKIEYKIPFHGVGIPEVSGGVVVIAETMPRANATLPPAAAAPPAAKLSPGGGGGGGGGELEVKDVVEIFRDSGTGSNNTPSTFCSDSGTGNSSSNKPPYHDEPHLAQLGVVPIPVFMSQQYRVDIMSDRHHHHHHHHNSRRVRRICSSASARAAPSMKLPSSAVDQNGERPDSLAPGEISGRRHSWCCPQACVDTKHYRTQSTQTITKDEISPIHGPVQMRSSKPDILLVNHDSQNQETDLMLNPNHYASANNHNNNNNDSFYTPPDHFTWTHNPRDFESSSGGCDHLTSSQFYSDSLPNADHDDPVFVVPNSASVTNTTRLKGGTDMERENGAIFTVNVHSGTPVHRGCDS